MFTTSSHAAWQLDQSNSSINFVTIKKGNIAESRNERMREFLFETGAYPTISINADVTSVIPSIETGQSRLISLPASLELHGVKNEISLALRVSKLSNEVYVVSSSEPVLIRAKDYAMLEGVLKLSSLVNNLPIAETVPVSFSLQFNKKS